MRQYEHTKVNGKDIDTHRLVWEQANGPIPAGLVVHHINGDKRDNRLENLALMTPAAHSALHNNKHQRVKACEVCRREFEPAPTKRKRARTCSPECMKALQSKIAKERTAGKRLTPDMVREARRRFADGETATAIAEEWGVDNSGLSRAIKGELWGHVT